MRQLLSTGTKKLKRLDLLKLSTNYKRGSTFFTQEDSMLKTETIVGYEYSKEFPTLHRIMTIMLRILKNPKSIKPDVPLHELITD
jgi:hypothetical protein